MHHQGVIPPPEWNLGRFRLAYTTDDRSTFADGLAIDGDVDANWVVITPGAARSNGGETDSSLPVGGPGGRATAISTSEFIVTTVPEPASTILAALGLAGLAGVPA